MSAEWFRLAARTSKGRRMALVTPATVETWNTNGSFPCVTTQERAACLEGREIETVFFDELQAVSEDGWNGIPRK